MSENTAENAEVQDNTPTTPEVPDTVQEIQIGENVFSIVGTTHKKGKSKGEPAFFLKQPDDGNFEPLFADIAEAVGKENWYKTVYAEVVRQACNDATKQAIATAADGKVSDAGWAKAFQEYFLPSTRRSGVHIKDLREKAMEIFGELNPLLARHFEVEKLPTGEPNPKYNPLSTQEHNRMLQLTLEYGDVNNKIEERSRKGKAAKK